MDHRFFACSFYRRQSGKAPCFQSSSAARQGNFYHSLHTDLYGLHYGALNEHGRNNRTKRNYRRSARNMASDGSSKFYYGFAAADILGRAVLQARFQSGIQTVISILRNIREKSYFTDNGTV